MMYCVLLVNKADSRLSALPTADTFNQSNFLTNPDFIYKGLALVSPEDYESIFVARDSVYILAPGLPLSDVAQISDPNRIYYQYDPVEMTLTNVPVSMEVYVADARQRKAVELQAELEVAKKGRFESGGRWYDKSTFLTFAVGFQNLGVDGLFSSAVSETAPFVPVMHTVSEVNTAVSDYYAWFYGLQTDYADKLQALAEADTLEEIEAI
ncbi:hypothetical protein ACO2Q8_07710 [Larkinella sp. VNQ87]|uniref:hypothetical protein n=1 Tax=Larkinella sp. VNQ87 TaxID=3400921 RepID=UPI003C076887